MSRSYPDELFRDISRSCLLHTGHTMQRCQPLCFALSTAAWSLTCAQSKLHEPRAGTPQLLNAVHPTSTGSVCSHPHLTSENSLKAPLLQNHVSPFPARSRSMPTLSRCLGRKEGNFERCLFFLLFILFFPFFFLFLSRRLRRHSRDR